MTKQSLKDANKKATDWLRKAGCIETDDQQILDYNNDIETDDPETINYKNAANMTGLNNTDKADFKKTSGAQLAAKKINIKYKNLKRKDAPVKIPAKKGKEEDIIFIRQDPLHPRD